MIKWRNFYKSYFLSLTILSSLLFYLLSGCQPHSANRVYHIGLGPWIGFGPLYLAQEKGFFKEAGIETKLSVIAGLAERNSALKSGRIDALAAPVDYFVSSAGNRLVTEIVMAIDESVGGDGIIAKKSIKNFQDLRGKKIAFQRGLPSEFFLRALLQKNGMSLTDLKETDMETALAGAAFIKGEVDAAVVWEPWLSRASEQGKGYVLASTKEYPNLIVDCLAFNQKVVEQSPEDVQKIVNAVLKAIAYWEKNPQEANKIMAPFFELDAAKYAQILSGAKFTNLTRNRQYFGTNENPGSIFAVAKQASDIWLKASVIEDAVNPKSIISPKFIDGALQYQTNVPSAIPISSESERIDWKDIVNIVSNLTQIAGAFPVITVLISTGIGGIGLWFLKIKKQLKPSSKNFKFQGQEFLVINTEGLIKREGNLQRSSDENLIVIRSQKPLEENYSFAKIVHKNIRKGLNYQYYFYCQGINSQTVEDVSCLLQTLSVVKILPDLKQQEKHDQELNWSVKTDSERIEEMRKNQNKDTIISNLERIQNKIIIYLLPGFPEETFCIHQAQNTNICYLRWDDSNVFIKLPKSEVKRKQNALKSELQHTDRHNQGILYIHPSLNITKQELLEKIMRKFPNEPAIRNQLEIACFGSTS